MTHTFRFIATASPERHGCSRCATANQLGAVTTETQSLEKRRGVLARRRATTHQCFGYQELPQAMRTKSWGRLPSDWDRRVPPDRLCIRRIGKLSRAAIFHVLSWRRVQGVWGPGCYCLHCSATVAALQFTQSPTHLGRCCPRAGLKPSSRPLPWPFDSIPNVFTRAWPIRCKT